MDSTAVQTDSNASLGQGHSAKAAEEAGTSVGAEAPLSRVDRTLALIHLALEEDVGSGDVTAELVLPPEAFATGVMEAKAAGTVSGLEVAAEVFRVCDSRVIVEAVVADGTRVRSGETLLTARGSARALLAAERTALNFVQRLSGIATLTHRFVERVRGTRAEIFDTRKTTPGFRSLEKYAVRMGGGRNHRMDLHDQVLLKENHFAAAAAHQLSWGRTVRVALEARERGVPVIVEVRNEGELTQALDLGVDVVMLDNFTLDGVKKAVAQRDARAGSMKPVALEVSGGVTLESVAALAATGVERISVGALTHSAPALDVAFYVR